MAQTNRWEDGPRVGSDSRSDERYVLNVDEQEAVATSACPVDRCYACCYSYDGECNNPTMAVKVGVMV